MANITTTLNFVQCTYVDSNNPNTAYDYPTPYPNYYGVNDDSLLLIEFAALPSNLKRNKLVSVTMTMQLTGDARALPLTGTFTRNVTTWDTKPDSYPNAVSSKLYLFGDGTSSFSDCLFASLTSFTAAQKAQAAALILKYSTLAIENSGNSCGLKDVLHDGVSTPYLTVTYDDSTMVTSQITYKSGPKSGYSNPRSATTFQWSYEKSDGSIFCADDSFTQTSATLYWKQSGAANYTAVTVSGSTTSVTVPANTFPSGQTIEWYLEGTDTDGTTTQSSVYSFSTAAGTAYAIAKSPISSVEDGSAPITLSWTLASTDGQTPSAVDLKWKLTSEDETQWHSLLSAASPVSSYTAAAGTFSAGEIEWTVRAYNIDGTAGPWSAPSSGYYSFICVQAPDPVSGLSATAVPFTSVSWQSSDQQGYEVSIDGEVVGQGFGAGVYSWTADEPLEDGSHVISVRVQGVYGFWSQPSTITITVANSAPTTITLTGTFSLDAILDWTFGATPPDTTVMVYRDGVWIGTASTGLFTDRRVLGQHSYFVILPDSSGNYSKSNTVTGTMSTYSKQIAPLDGSAGWLELRLSENSADEDSFKWSRTQVLQHVTGAAYPQTELSSFEDLTATYNCAFVDRTQRQAFEALRGKAVIMKTRSGNVVTGILAQLTKRQTVFYTAYSFSISQIHVRDFEEAD